MSHFQQKNNSVAISRCRCPSSHHWFTPSKWWRLLRPTTALASWVTSPAPAGPRSTCVGAATATRNSAPRPWWTRRLFNGEVVKIMPPMIFMDIFIMYRLSIYTQEILQFFLVGIQDCYIFGCRGCIHTESGHLPHRDQGVSRARAGTGAHADACPHRPHHPPYLSCAKPTRLRDPDEGMAGWLNVKRVENWNLKGQVGSKEFNVLEPTVVGKKCVDLDDWKSININ